MVMPIVGAVRVRAVREPPHAHQAKRLFGLVNGLQLTRIRPVWTPHWYYPFSDITCGVRRGEASGKYLAFEPRISSPDASPLQPSTFISAIAHTIGQTPIPTINIAIT